MTRRDIRIRTRDGMKVIDASGYGVEVFGRFAVHRLHTVSGEPSRERGCWQITHVPSGYGVTAFNFGPLPRKRARKLAKRLDSELSVEWDIANQASISAAERRAARTIIDSEYSAP